MNIPIDISGTVLRTRRLVLRPWCEADLEDFYAYASVNGVGEMAGWPHHRSVQESEAILKRFIHGRKTFALVQDGRVIGSLGIEEYDEEELPELADCRCRELGFVLAKDCWGQGLMPEAVSEAIRWMFEEQNADLLVCRHYASNRQSARVQQKCGFHEYKRTAHRNALEEDVISVTNLLTRKEWEQQIQERSTAV